MPNKKFDEVRPALVRAFRTDQGAAIDAVKTAVTTHVADGPTRQAILATLLDELGLNIPDTVPAGKVERWLVVRNVLKGKVSETELDSIMAAIDWEPDPVTVEP